jgi:DNA-binding transcriptional ArsR family regulator
MESESKIIDAVYEDELFGFMTFGELLERTGLSKPTLRHHLKELCQEREREGLMNLEVYEALNLIESGKLRREDRNELLKHPTLITKRGVYMLHPTTKEAMDSGVYPYRVKEGDKDRLLRLMKHRSKDSKTKVELKIREAAPEEIREALRERLEKLKDEVRVTEKEIGELSRK